MNISEGLRKKKANLSKKPVQGARHYARKYAKGSRELGKRIQVYKKHTKQLGNRACKKSIRN